MACTCPACLQGKEAIQPDIDDVRDEEYMIFLEKFNVPTLNSDSEGVEDGDCMNQSSLVDGLKSRNEERAAIVAWLRHYDEASPHDKIARDLALRIERGEHRDSDAGCEVIRG